MTSTPGRWRWRLCGVLLGVAIALVLAELTLRWLRLPDTNRLFLSAESFTEGLFTSDPELFWVLAPTHPERNAAGLRGPWCGGPKSAGETRILAVGDSCTFGIGAPWEETYAAQLERLLQARRQGPVRAALAALPGYSTFQNRRQLERVLPDVQPDIVLFYCGAWNDFVPAAGATDAELAGQIDTSRLLALLRGAFRPSLAHYRAAFQRGEAPHGRRVDPADFERNLQAMVAACRSRGAFVVLIAPTHPSTTTDQFPGLTEYRDRVVGLAQRLAAPLVDLAVLCRQLDPSDAPPIPGDATACFTDWVHPAANVHTALARALAELLDTVPAPPTPSPTPSPSPPLLAKTQELVVPFDPGAGEALHRVWLGPRLVRGVAAAAELRVALPHDLPPGEHLLQVVTAEGARDLARVAVPAAAITLAWQLAGDRHELTFRGEGEPGRVVWLWLARAAGAPVATPFGEFALATPTLQQPVAGVVRFDLAVADRHMATVGADGRWLIQLPVGPEALASWQTTFAQALVLDPATRRGALTAVARVPDR